METSIFFSVILGIRPALTISFWYCNLSDFIMARERSKGQWVLDHMIMMQKILWKQKTQKWINTVIGYKVKSWPQFYVRAMRKTLDSKSTRIFWHGFSCSPDWPLAPAPAPTPLPSELWDKRQVTPHLVYMVLGMNCAHMPGKCSTNWHRAPAPKNIHIPLIASNYENIENKFDKMYQMHASNNKTWLRKSRSDSG